jgi:hypothetical protein
MRVCRDVMRTSESGHWRHKAPKACERDEARNLGGLGHIPALPSPMKAPKKNHRPSRVPDFSFVLGLEQPDQELTNDDL